MHDTAPRLVSMNYESARVEYRNAYHCSLGLLALGDEPKAEASSPPVNLVESTTAEKVPNTSFALDQSSVPSGSGEERGNNARADAVHGTVDRRPSNERDGPIAKRTTEPVSDVASGAPPDPPSRPIARRKAGQKASLARLSDFFEAPPAQAPSTSTSSHSSFEGIGRNLTSFLDPYTGGPRKRRRGGGGGWSEAIGPHTRCSNVLCGRITPGNGPSCMWRKGWIPPDDPFRIPVPLCNACGMRFKKCKYCPHCLQVYFEREGRTGWAVCSRCYRWVHRTCAAEAGLPLPASTERIGSHAIDAESGRGDAGFLCAACMGLSVGVIRLASPARVIPRSMVEEEAGEESILDEVTGTPTSALTI